MQPQPQTATLVRASNLRPTSSSRSISKGNGEGRGGSNVPFACRHTCRMLVTTGSVYFSAGEVIDTIHTVSVCLDCGEEFPANL